MNQPHYTTAALADLESILRYIAKDKPSAALAWVEKIEAKCLLIATMPEMGELQPKLGESVRSNVVGRYVIFHGKRTIKSRSFAFLRAIRISPICDRGMSVASPTPRRRLHE